VPDKRSYGKNDTGGRLALYLFFGLVSRRQKLKREILVKEGDVHSGILKGKLQGTGTLEGDFVKRNREQESLFPTRGCWRGARDSGDQQKIRKWPEKRHRLWSLGHKEWNLVCIILLR